MSNDYREEDHAPEDDQKEESSSLEDLSYDELLQKTRETAAQKRHLQKKLKEAQEASKKQEPQPEPKNEEVIQKPSSVSEDEWKKRIDFVTGKGRDLDSEEVNTVIALAKGKGVSYEEALTDPVFKAFKEAKDTERRVANATPASKGTTTKVNGKSWETMSKSEKKANFQEYMKQRLGK